MSLLDASYAGADQCDECGAPYQPVSSSSSGGPAASYSVCRHAWGCSERKPTWPDHLNRSMP